MLFKVSNESIEKGGVLFRYFFMNKNEWNVPLLLPHRRSMKELTNPEFFHLKTYF